MEHHIQNKYRVSIIYIEWEKSEIDMRTKLNDLFNSGAITYAKAIFFERSTPLSHLIARFGKRMSELQILKHFPTGTLKMIHSWKTMKQLIKTTTKDDGKIFEIGNDNSSMQHVKFQYHEKRRSTKRYEKAKKSCTQSLYDIVKLN